MENDRMPVVGFVYNRKKTVTKTKGAVIEIQVSYDYKKKYLSTGVKVLPKEWREQDVLRVLSGTCGGAPVRTHG
uniref:Arm DNA-binding domain-containing protein n=1 Tax=Prevotella sp. TaxID=59823 RepID=UPI0040295850